VAIVDYGAGNLHSVRRALERAGARVAVTADPEGLRAANGVVFPGQGSARAAMEQLDSSGLSGTLRERVAEGAPLLGVCLGMQLFFGPNEEGSSHGLDLLPGRVVRLREKPRTPHMGWNGLELRAGSPLLAGVPEGSHAYFAHSYQALPGDPGDVVATCDYEGEVVAVVARGNVLGAQFHPEKSGSVGLRMYENFVRLVLECS
jgi:glutamine amidotransferase